MATSPNTRKIPVSNLLGRGNDEDPAFKRLKIISEEKKKCGHFVPTWLRTQTKVQKKLFRTKMLGKQFF